MRDLGLTGLDDTTVFDRAVVESRIMVTENLADFAALLDRRLRANQPCVPVVFVRKADLPGRGAMAVQLARWLDAWARAHPDPYLGSHWP